MTQPARSTVPHPPRRPSPPRRPKPRSVPRQTRAAAAATLTLALALTATACAGTSSTLSDAVKGNSTDPGCIAALSAISEYGPRAVTDLAQGRVDVNKAIVHLLVLALDAAADTADQPSDKQAISTLANIYEEYYQFKTNLVAIPIATLLKDTTNLDSACKN